MMKLSKPKKVAAIIVISVIVYFIGILFYRNHLLKKHELYSDTFVVDPQGTTDTYLSVLMRSARFRKANKDERHSYIMQWTEDYANKKIGEMVNLLLLGVIIHGIVFLLFVKDEDMK